MIPSPVFFLIDLVLNLYSFVVLVTVVLSWLVSFNVVNRHNAIVDAVWRTAVGLTEPLLAPIRRMLPSLGGLDLSPVVLLIAIVFLRQTNSWLAAKLAF